MYKDYRGQTLIETLVGLFVVTVGVVSTVTLVVATTNAGAETEREIIAANLAREGVEAVRGIRDDNWLHMEANGGDATKAWDDRFADLQNPHLQTMTAIYDPTHRTWDLDNTADDFTTLCNDGTGGTFVCADIYRDNNGLYRQFADGEDPAGDNTHFQRIVTLYNICKDGTNGITIETSDNCPPGDFSQRKIGVHVKAEVKYTSNGTEKTYTLEEKLFQWKEIAP